MIGNLAVYTALTQPGDTVMSAPQPMGAIQQPARRARRGPRA